MESTLGSSATASRYRAWDCTGLSACCLRERAAARARIAAMRRALRIFILLWALAPAAANSQAYPTKPIRLVVPYSSGTTTDVFGRLFAQKLSENLGQPVIVEQ